MYVGHPAWFRGRVQAGVPSIWGCTAHTWSRTQCLVAKSSAEAELYASVRAACEALGMQTLMNDLGRDIPGRMFVDAAAATSTIEREGPAKVRHIGVNLLWLQEQEVQRRLPWHNMFGTTNPADLMTKHSGKQGVEKYIGRLGIYFEDGRSEKAPQLHALRVVSELCSSDLSNCEKKAKKTIPRDNQREHQHTTKGRGIRDKWQVAEDVGVRAHHRPGRKFFTPVDVKTDGIRYVPLQGVRV